MTNFCQSLRNVGCLMMPSTSLTRRIILTCHTSRKRMSCLTLTHPMTLREETTLRENHLCIQQLDVKMTLRSSNKRSKDSDIDWKQKRFYLSRKNWDISKGRTRTSFKTSKHQQVGNKS